MFRHRPAHLTVLLAGGVVICVLVLLHGINGATADGRFLSLDQEANLPSWLRVVLFFTAAAACAAAGSLGDRPVWLGLAAVLLAFSLDDLAQGHEWLEEQTDAHSLITVVEPLVALAFAAGLVVVCRRLGRPQSWLILTGSASLLGAFAAAAVNDDRSHAETVLLSTIEQSCEMAFGWFLLAAAIDPARRGVIAWAQRSPASTGP